MKDVKIFFAETVQGGTVHKCDREGLICCSRYETKAAPVI